MDRDDSVERSEIVCTLHDLLLRADRLEEVLAGVAVLAGKLVAEPCVAAVTVEVSGRPLTVSSADGPVPWTPSWTVPLSAAGVDGRLDVYADDAQRPLEPAYTRAMESYAALAAPVVALAVREAELRRLNDQLTAALSSRTVIDQAIGVLMAQQRCGAHQAFDLLRQHSQNTNRKLREVATDIVARTAGERPDDRRS
ncbi:ANTAR domain-containing protein [Nocardioides sp. TF02-7]|uniref:ANTAR domain-containing protein n=1 Tax=Nocardioides sp. TF02-7 TaxID=2917724 RepID=UPI001F0688F9|nr:ANTAR domain-containing protein [Nocardioides sp. TF02-7]UMG91678.1 ANTAR domain-containing protein [Nocardioides sp. TF02-7]